MRRIMCCSSYQRTSISLDLGPTPRTLLFFSLLFSSLLSSCFFFFIHGHGMALLRPNEQLWCGLTQTALGPYIGAAKKFGQHEISVEYSITAHISLFLRNHKKLYGRRRYFFLFYIDATLHPFLIFVFSIAIATRRRRKKEREKKQKEGEKRVE